MTSAAPASKPCTIEPCTIESCAIESCAIEPCACEPGAAGAPAPGGAAPLCVPGADVNAGMFLAGVAGLLRETVERFETISSGVSAAVMSRAGMADRDLIVTLQAFDRLQQEFVAVADVLSRYSGALGESLACRNAQARFEAEAIAAIAVTDLKQRLLHHLQREQLNELDPPPAGEEVF